VGDALLSAEGVVAGYGDLEVLREVTFEVPGGSVTALIGGNGGGKTTTLRAVSGLIPLRRGRIRFAGRDLAALRPDEIAARGIAHVPEGRRVFPLMTVQENLELGAYARAARRERAATLPWVFELFPRLAERRRQPAGTLSGGEQQMLAIGRGLMSRPRLLVLDEPSLGLMPRLVADLFDRLADINQRGLTILLVEQNVREAMTLASHFYVLESGRVVRGGRYEEFVEDQQLREAYLGVKGGSL
jgi:branched-chain amino acid transport system ATP-binding protein